MTKQTLLVRSLLLVFIGLMLGACAQSNNVVSNRMVQKRKYNKGWFVKWGEDSRNRSDERNKTAGDAKKHDWEAIIAKSNGAKNESGQKAPEEQLTSVTHSDRIEDNTQEVHSSSDKKAIVSESSFDEQQLKSMESSQDQSQIQEFPILSVFPMMPSFRPYDGLLDPIFILGSFAILLILIVVIALFSLEVEVLFIFAILAFTFAGIFIASFVRLLIGLGNYGISSDLEVAALIVGIVGFLAIVGTILFVIFL
ncbi:hypothetical protein N9355_03415 [Crocinitomicaceae bacterium]|nr:hypothetical protein [Crocinitomicaceae bacterium]